MSIWNTGNIARICRASLAGFALAFLSASLTEAGFGPRASVGKNYQQTSNTTSTNAINGGPCIDVASCFVLFQPIPRQQPLIVRHVSCTAFVGADDLRIGTLLTRNGNTILFKQTHLVPVNMSGQIWMINSPAMHVLESGERPVIKLQSGAAGDWAVECNISGELHEP